MTTLEAGRSSTCLRAWQEGWNSCRSRAASQRPRANPRIRVCFAYMHAHLLPRLSALYMFFSASAKTLMRTMIQRGRELERASF